MLAARAGLEHDLASVWESRGCVSREGGGRGEVKERSSEEGSCKLYSRLCFSMVCNINKKYGVKSAVIYAVTENKACLIRTDTG